MRRGREGGREREGQRECEEGRAKGESGAEGHGRVRSEGQTLSDVGEHTTTALVCRALVSLAACMHTLKKASSRFCLKGCCCSHKEALSPPCTWLAVCSAELSRSKANV